MPELLDSRHCQETPIERFRESSGQIFTCPFFFSWLLHVTGDGVFTTVVAK